MEETKYVVLFDDEIIAIQMNLSDALILVEALINKHHKDIEYGSTVSIAMMKKEDMFNSHVVIAKLKEEKNG